MDTIPANDGTPSDSLLHIEGAGPVTVVFEAALGDTGKVWRSVQSSVARSCARTVSYTRSGYGVRHSADGPRDAEHLQNEIVAVFATQRHEFVIDSGHYIQRDQPQAVINAARELARCDIGQKRVEPARLL